MASNRKRRRLMGEINVVPYIDVMLVLLVIFMITAPMLSQGVKVDLPQADSQPIPQDDSEPLVVTVDAAGDYYLSLGEDPKAPLGADALLEQLGGVLSRREGMPVYVKGDRHVAYGKVVELMALIQGAGVPSVGLMTETPEETDGR
ncbi:MAG: protein TolR [Gammaproteobacteria bacterium]|nr:protein TolR [Gammaproteobacteria bacterium]MCW8840134.1 protein TolR [Gammaproteobacteria bacterium]MCW8959791.1 protein TolR [Gammaproteobacteria bacterium]MCW8973726.1 protein TolR [Gammaproteobacteria bacterium]MCW8992831.1 protein TolR [Gammaproteobacteria bacterium]